MKRCSGHVERSSEKPAENFCPKSGKFAHKGQKKRKLINFYKVIFSHYVSLETQNSVCATLPIVFHQKSENFLLIMQKVFVSFGKTAFPQSFSEHEEVSFDHQAEVLWSKSGEISLKFQKNRNLSFFSKIFFQKILLDNRI